MDKNYVSGMGKDSVVPEEIKCWNWGAFLLNWVWGIGNSTYIALLMFVPFVNFVMLFILAAKGNEWAWKNRTWRDVQHFKSTQKKWRNAGFVFILIFFSLLLIPLLSLMKGQAYDLSVAAVQTNTQVINMVGKRPEPSFFVLGEISYNGSSGNADLNYSIEGAKGRAEVYVYATKLGGSWKLQELLVVNEVTGERVVLVTRSE